MAIIKTDLSDQEFFYEDYYEAGNNCSICRICLSQIAGTKKMSNLKRHLTLKHGITFKLGPRTKRPRIESDQPALTSFICNKFDDPSPLTKYLQNVPPDALTEFRFELFQMTLEMGLPFSFFHAAPIKKRLSKWIPHFKIPHSQSFIQMADTHFDDIRMKMVEKLASIRHLTVVLDRWSDEDSLDLLGLWSYFYNTNSGTRDCFLLGLTFMDSLPNEDNLSEWIDRVLSDFDVPLEKILLCFIDNNRNQIIGCKKLFINRGHFSAENDGQRKEIGDEIETSDSVISSTNFDLLGSSESFDEYDQLEEFEDEPFEVTTNLSYFTQANPINLRNYVMKIPSASFSVELLVVDLKIHFVNVFSAIDRVRDITRKLRTSKSVQQYLNKNNETNFPIANRWSSTYEMMRHFIHLQTTGVLKTIIEIFNATQSSTSEIEMEPPSLDEFMKYQRIFELIANLSEKFQSAQASLSCVIPHLMDFKESIKETCSDSKSVCSILLQLVQEKFDWALNPVSANFVELAALATYLDDKYKIYLEVPAPESSRLLKAKPLKLEEETSPTLLALSSPYLAKAFRSQSLDRIDRYDPKELKEFSEDLSAVPCSQDSVENVFSMSNLTSNKYSGFLNKNFEKRILYLVNSYHLR